MSANVAPALLGARLRLGHLAYLRAIAQGLQRTDVARRYLAIEHRAETAAAHRAVVDLVAAIARRRHDPRWRLLGIEIEAPPSATIGGAPSLES